MATVNLTGQSAQATQIQAKITVMKTLLDQRAGVLKNIHAGNWQKISQNDPVVAVAYQAHLYLRDFFK